MAMGERFILIKRLYLLPSHEIYSIFSCICKRSSNLVFLVSASQINTIFLVSYMFLPSCTLKQTFSNCFFQPPKFYLCSSLSQPCSEPNLTNGPTWVKSNLDSIPFLSSVIMIHLCIRRCRMMLPSLQ